MVKKYGGRVAWGTIFLVIFIGCGAPAEVSSTALQSPILASEITVAPAVENSEVADTLVQLSATPPTITAEEEAFLNQLAEDTWGYLSSDWATTHDLPWSWRSATLSGGDYVNPTEIGFLALSWIAAFEMDSTWSPTWSETDQHVQSILDQLRAWQTGSQIDQPHGANAYQNQVFYQWYWVSWPSPVVGAPTGDNHLVPSVDNAWLAASLIAIQQYAIVHGHTAMANSATDILADMDFMLWFDPPSARFHWGGIEDPMGGGLADYYSNENRIINFVARALGDLDTETYLRSLDALEKPVGAYDQIEVRGVAWDGSFFTYAAPALFIREMDTWYGPMTLTPALLAQITYARDEQYTAWGLSDCYDIADGGYIQQGAPPTGASGPLETHPGVVTPHVSALALITPLQSEAISNLETLATDFPSLYQPGYGFLDAVMADPNNAAYGMTSNRFATLDQEWIFLSLANVHTGFVWDYFYRHPGVQVASQEAYPKVYLPAVQH